MLPGLVKFPGDRALDISTSMGKAGTRTGRVSSSSTPSKILWRWWTQDENSWGAKNHMTNQAKDRKNQRCIEFKFYINTRYKFKEKINKQKK
jgi:hypothetical protein